jgi:flagellar motor switch protein FliM
MTEVKSPKITELLQKNKQDVTKALHHLEYSFKKIQSFDFRKTDWSEEELETLESFSSRFARCSDLILSRLLRS